MADEVTRDVYQLDASDAIKAWAELSKVAAYATMSMEENIQKLVDLQEAQMQASTAAGDHKEKQESLAHFFKEDFVKSLQSAQAGYELLKESIKAVGEFVKEGMDAFLDGEKADLRLAHALKLAGFEADNTASAMGDYADTVKRATGIDDDYTKHLQQMLIQLGVAPAQVQRVAAAALDLAAVTGTDATNAARLMAKASAENSAELKKFGISVDEAEVEARGFVAVLEEVERVAGGTAFQMNEQTRTLNETKAAWEDFQEAVGGLAVEFLSLKSAGSGFADVLDGLTEFISNKTSKSLDAHAAKLNAVNAAMEDEVRLIEAVREGELELEKLKGSPFYDAKLKNLEEMRKQLPEVEKMRKHLQGFDTGPAPVMKFDASEALDIESDLPKRMKAERKTRLDAFMQEYNDTIKQQFALAAAEQKADEEYLRADKEAAAGVAKAAEEQHQEAIQAQQNENTEMARLFREQRETHEAELIQEQAALDQFYQSTQDTILGFGESLLSSQLDYFKDSLLENTAFTKAYRDRSIERRQADLAEMGVTKSKAEVTQELAAEEGAANQKRIAEILAGIATQSVTKALFETAEGFAAAAVGNPLAGAHFTAAAGYAAVAALAGGAAVALSKGRGNTKEEREQLEQFDEQDRKDKEKNATGTGTSAAPGTETVGGGMVLNVYNVGIAGVTEQDQAKELERLRVQYDKRRTGGT